jgi:phenylpyruvate tautomerase PptA (4-oxalocrotonate tautomerase family)
MPLTRVSVRRGRSPQQRTAILRNIYEAMHEVFNVPADDYFMVLTEHDASDFIFPARFSGLEHSDNFVMVQITCNNTRNTEQKQALYKRIVERLAADPGVAPNDVLISIVEVVKENWSMGNGVATFV